VEGSFAKNFRRPGTAGSEAAAAQATPRDLPNAATEFPMPHREGNDREELRIEW
jgi:hypothetical protein